MAYYLPAAASGLGATVPRGIQGSTRRIRARIVLASLSVALSIVLFGCGAAEPPPALLIDDVGYSEAELGALTAEQREELAVLTAFGIVTARSELSRLADPFVERERHSRLLRKLSREISVREAGFDEEHLRAAYDAAPEYELVVRHLVILSERWRPDEHRMAARARAAEALQAVRRGEAFAAVAGEYSEEPGAAKRGGLLEAGRRGTWVAEFWEAASALEAGSVSEVVETPYGYHVLRLEERRVIPLDEVRDEVLGRLVDLRAAAPRADEWAARTLDALVFDEAAIIAWRETMAPNDLLLASWPGGSYQSGELRRYLATLDRSAGERIATAESSTYLEVVRALAGNALLVQRAGELGINLSQAEIQELEESGLVRFQGLAAALGFRRGAPAPTIKATALKALAPGAQRALIARAEVLEVTAALQYLYPMALNPQ